MREYQLDREYCKVETNKFLQEKYTGGIEIKLIYENNKDN